MTSPLLILDKLPVQLCIKKYELSVNGLGQEELPEAYSLIQAEAKLGQDMGQDEIPSEAFLLSHLSRSHNFAFRDGHTGRLVCLLTVAPSTYSRMVTPLLASAMIVCEHQSKMKTLLQAVIEVSLDITADLQFEGLLVDVFSTSSLREVFFSEGFTVVGRIPSSGYLQGHGWTDSLIMFKSIQYAAGQFLKVGDYQKCQLHPIETSTGPAEISCSRAEIKVKSINYMPSLVHLNQKPRSKNLPRIHTFSNGVTTSIRYMQEADILQVYQMFRKAAKQGRGYSTDEFATPEIFRYCVFEHGHPIVIQDRGTTNILVAVSIVPSIFCRSVNPLLADPFLVVDEGFQAQGLGMEVCQLMLRFTRELGYVGVLADYLADNEAAGKMQGKLGFTVTGCIPKGARGMDNKVVDLFLCYKHLGLSGKLGSKL